MMLTISVLVLEALDSLIVEVLDEGNSTLCTDDLPSLTPPWECA